MHINNKKTGFILIALLLISLGYLLGVMSKKSVNETSSENENSKFIRLSAQNSTKSSFFSELEKSMIGYEKGGVIEIKQISFRDEIAIISYSKHQEGRGFLVVDFRNNKFYKTLFGEEYEYSFTPILIASPERLIAINQGIDNVSKLMLTDLSGNVIKELKSFILKDQKDFDSLTYTDKYEHNLFSVLGVSYTFDNDYNLVPLQ